MNPLDLINNQDDSKMGMNLDDELKFGKYKGSTIREVLSFDGGYIKWLIDNTDHSFSKEVMDYDIPDETDDRCYDYTLGDLPF